MREGSELEAVERWRVRSRAASRELGCRPKGGPVLDLKGLEACLGGVLYGTPIELGRVASRGF